MYQPNETMLSSLSRLSSLSSVSFPFGWLLPVLILGVWGGSSPLKNKTQMYSKAAAGHSWLAAVVLPGQSGDSVKPGDEMTV